LKETVMDERVAIEANRQALKRILAPVNEGGSIRPDLSAAHPFRVDKAGSPTHLHPHFRGTTLTLSATLPAALK